MLNRRNWVVSIIALLVVLSVAACTAAPVQVPNRDVKVDVDTALAAQNKAAGLMSGKVDWTESEFSSLVSVLLQQNGGTNNPVNGVKVWFEPNNQVFAEVDLKEGVIPNVTKLDLAGTVSVKDNHVMVDLNAAGTDNMSVTGASLAPINQQLNTALADPSLGVAANVSTDTGTISVGLGGM